MKMTFLSLTGQSGVKKGVILMLIIFLIILLFTLILLQLFKTTLRDNNTRKELERLKKNKQTLAKMSNLNPKQIYEDNEYNEDKEIQENEENEVKVDENESYISTNPSPLYSNMNMNQKGYLELNESNNQNRIEGFISVPEGVPSDTQNNLYKLINHSKPKSLHIKLDNLKIYLLNMKQNMDRLYRFLNAFNKSDLKDSYLERIEGINGKKINIRNFVDEKSYFKILKAEKKGYRLYHYELTRGAVGCYLSHLKIYRNVAEQDEEFAMIFEDDVKIIKPNLLHEINNVLSSIPSDWDILLLGCVCFVCGKFVTYYDVNRYFLMHGYLIKKSSAKKILHLLENELIKQQIDAKLSDMAEKGLIKIYCLRDKLAVQWNMGTTIQLPVKTIKGLNPFDPLYDN